MQSTTAQSEPEATRKDCPNCDGFMVTRDRFDVASCIYCGQPDRPILRAEDVEDPYAHTGGNPQHLNGTAASAPQSVEAVFYCQPNYFSPEVIAIETRFSFVFKPMSKSSMGHKFKVQEIIYGDDLALIMKHNGERLRYAKWPGKGWNARLEIAFCIITAICKHLGVEHGEIIGMKTCLAALHLVTSHTYLKICESLAV